MKTHDLARDRRLRMTSLNEQNKMPKQDGCLQGKEGWLVFILRQEVDDAQEHQTANVHVTQTGH